MRRECASFAEIGMLTVTILAYEDRTLKYDQKSLKYVVHVIGRNSNRKTSFVTIRYLMSYIYVFPLKLKMRQNCVNFRRKIV